MAHTPQELTSYSTVVQKKCSWLLDAPSMRDWRPKFLHPVTLPSPGVSWPCAFNQAEGERTRKRGQFSQPLP